MIRRVMSAAIAASCLLSSTPAWAYRDWMDDIADKYFTGCTRDGAGNGGMGVTGWHCTGVRGANGVDALPLGAKRHQTAPRPATEAMPAQSSATPRHVAGQNWQSVRDVVNRLRAAE